jgi:hypothetical protein
MRKTIGVGAALSAALGLGLAAGPAAAGSPPKRADGLWEITTSTNAGKSSARECIDRSTDRLVKQALTGQTCRNDDFKQTPEGYAAGAICRTGGMTVDGRVVVTGDFETWARAEATTVMTGLAGEAGPRTFRTTIDVRRLGDCEPGQVPGDVVLPNGKTIHVAPGGK